MVQSQVYYWIHRDSAIAEFSSIQWCGEDKNGNSVMTTQMVFESCFLHLHTKQLKDSIYRKKPLRTTRTYRNKIFCYRAILPIGLNGAF